MTAYPVSDTVLCARRQDGVPGWALGTEPLPATPPRPGQLLLAMLASPINPADLLVIDGRYPHPVATGSVLGAEGVGRVVAVGPGVSDLTVGQLALPLDRGNWASHRLVSADRLIPVDPGTTLSVDALATLRINPATAWRLLDGVTRDAGPLEGSFPEAGDWIIQSAAGSSVARAVTVIAAARGIQVINVVRDPARYPHLANAIADDASLSPQDFAARVRKITGGAPVRLALDAVAGETSGRLAACLAPGGLLRVYGHLSGRPCAVPSTLLTGQAIRIDGFTLRRAEGDDDIAGLRAFYARLLAVMAPGYGAGEEALTTSFPLSRLNDAIAAARTALSGQAGTARAGRVMVHFDPQQVILNHTVA